MAFTKLEPTGVNTSATFTFSNVSVTGSMNTTGVSNLGPVSNVQITGGTNGYVLSTDGSGTLSWVAQTGGGSSYSNANVGEYLPNYTGNFGANIITATGNISGLNLQVTNSSGDEGGEILLAKAQTNTSISGTGVTIDVYQNKLRIFEQGGTARGGFFDITALGAGASTDLLAGGGGGYANSNVAAYLPTYTGNFTAGNISVTGNTTSAYFIGNGSSLTSITGGNVTGQVGNALVASTVYSNAQPNITSVGTLSSLTITGLVTATGGGVKTSNIIDSTGTNTISVSSATVGIIGNLSVGTGGAGNINATNAVLSGGITTGGGTGGNITGANVISATTVTATGNVTAGNIKTDNLLYANGVAWSFGGGGGGASISNGTSNINIGSANANITVGVNGTSNVAVFSNVGANITGNLVVSGTLSAGAGTGGSIAGANSITANYFSGKRYAETVVNGGTTSGTLTPDVNQGTIFQYTLNGAVTINALGNAVAGTSATIILTQDATGSRTLTSSMKFAGASKTLTTTAAAIDIMSVFYDGTTYYAALSKGYA
jgi:hypothetical protein